MSKNGFAPILVYIIISVVVLGGIGGGVYFYNQEKSITGQAINDLKSQLEEQNKILEEQTELTAEQQAKAEAEKEKLASQIEELSKETCKDVQVPYDAQETYTEKEPYSKTETYYESEPYVEEVCNNIPLAYNTQSGSCIQYQDNFFANDEPAKYSYTINNLDSASGGTFIVDIGFYIGGQLIKEEQSQYIYPSSSKTFYAEKMATIDSCYFNVKVIPTKQVCEDVTKYHDVQKTRQVTDYKTVTKTRTVTKYKTETVCE